MDISLHRVSDWKPGEGLFYRVLGTDILKWALEKGASFNGISAREPGGRNSLFGNLKVCKEGP